jgi:hypothetical protein
MSDVNIPWTDILEKFEWSKTEAVVAGILDDMEKILSSSTKTLKLVEQILGGESFLNLEPEHQQWIGSILYAHVWEQYEWELSIWDITTELNILRKKVRGKEERV